MKGELPWQVILGAIEAVRAAGVCQVCRERPNERCIVGWGSQKIYQCCEACEPQVLTEMEAAWRMSRTALPAPSRGCLAGCLNTPAVKVAWSTTVGTQEHQMCQECAREFDGTTKAAVAFGQMTVTYEAITKENMEKAPR